MASLPAGLSLNEDTGEISGTPTADGTAKFTVKAENSAGSDTKELSITITKAAPAEHTVTVTTDGNGTASASPAKAVAGTEIALTANAKRGLPLQGVAGRISGRTVTITDDKFTHAGQRCGGQGCLREGRASCAHRVSPSP